MISTVHASNNDGTYGANNVWRELSKTTPVARCTVERLMSWMGLRGVVRGRAFKVTTQSDAHAPRPSTWVMTFRTKVQWK